MKKVVTLTGKNLPRLSVAKPGWPEHNGAIAINGEWMPITVSASTIITPQAVSDFTRVCDQTGLSERLRATWNTKKPRQPEG